MSEGIRHSAFCNLLPSNKESPDLRRMATPVNVSRVGSRVARPTPYALRYCLHLSPHTPFVLPPSPPTPLTHALRPPLPHTSHVPRPSPTPFAPHRPSRLAFLRVCRRRRWPGRHATSSGRNRLRRVRLKPRTRGSYSRPSRRTASRILPEPLPPPATLHIRAHMQTVINVG